MKTDLLDLIAKVLVIIGAINWGLVGLLKLDLVVLLFGGVPILVKVVYILVGLSGLYLLIFMLKGLKKA